MDSKQYNKKGEKDLGGINDFECIAECTTSIPHTQREKISEIFRTGALNSSIQTTRRTKADAVVV